jgi:UDP-glucose 4-epimerase
MSSTVIVAGAAGFIGRYVCRAFALQGFRVLGVGHGSWDSEEWRAWGLSRWHAADISVESLRTVAGEDNIIAVIQCAGGSSVPASYAAPYDDYLRTVESTAQLLEFSRLQMVASPRVVLTSSAAVYGDQGEVDMTESGTYSPMSPYGFNKVLSEKICDSYSRFFGVNVSVVRLFSVYGEGLRKQLLWDAMCKFLRNDYQFFGTGHELRDWVHVEDVARLIVLAATAKQAQYEVYNGAHTHATTRDVLTKLAIANGMPIEPMFNNEMHVGNPRRLTANYQHVRSRLLWNPEVRLDDGISRYAAWFKDVNPL